MAEHGPNVVLGLYINIIRIYLYLYANRSTSWKSGLGDQRPNFSPGSKR